MNNRISAVCVLMMAVLFSSCTNLFNDLLWEDRIVFSTDEPRIYVMNTDGSGMQPLTDINSYDPSWSPDGSQIAFTSNRGSAYWSIYVMDEDGANQVKVIDLIGKVLRAPTWSPDGSKMCFTNDTDVPVYSIWVANADGSNPHPIGSGQGANFNTSSWSPDGSRIAFSNSGAEISIINANGTNLHSITSDSDTNPSWSPDGKKIAFQTNRDGNNEIYVMNSNGSGQHNITNQLASEEMLPSWSPDGTKIAFVSQRGLTNWNVYIMDADGSNQTRLTYFSGTVNVYVTCFYRKPR